MLGYPFFNHYGAAGTNDLDSYIPRQCSCSDSTSSSAQCKDFNFLSGVVVYDTSAYKAICEFAYSFAKLNKDINSLVYNATFASAVLGNGQKDYLSETLENGTTDRTNFENLISSTWRASAYDFCTNDCKGILTVHSYDTYSYFVSPWAHQLTSGSCKNTFNITSKAWYVISLPVSHTSILPSFLIANRNRWCSLLLSLLLELFCAF
jgi:hypothetical protein